MSKLQDSVAAMKQRATERQGAQIVAAIEDDTFMAMAWAVIETIREPSNAMLTAGTNLLHDSGAVAGVWNAMIDAMVEP